MTYTDHVPYEMPPQAVRTPDAPRININIDHKSESNKELQQAIDIGQRMVFGPMPATTVPRETHDEYGTPLGLENLPDVFDAREGRLDMDRRLVTSMSMLAMRMKWGPFTEEQTAFNPLTPFEHVSIHRGTEKVVVFIVASGEPVTMTDEASMFPSDMLVGKIRLLEAAMKPQE